MRKLMIVLSFLVYYGLLIAVILVGIPGFDGFLMLFGVSMDWKPELVVASLDMTLKIAFWLIPVTVWRWKLRMVSWGTFCVTFFALAVGFFHWGFLAMYRHGTAMVLVWWFGAFTCFSLSFWCNEKNIASLRALIVNAARNQSRPK